MERDSAPFTEQTESYWEGHPGASPISPMDRSRAIAMVMRRAHECVGEGGGPDLVSRLQYILKHARERGLPASIYEVVWGMHRIMTDHLIIDRGAGELTE